MDIYYMSNGLTFELSNIFLQNFQDRSNLNKSKIGFTKFHENRLRID